MRFTKQIQVQNPLKPGERTMQEVIVSDSLQYDYSKSKWIAIDTEFIGKQIAAGVGVLHTRLTYLQIASEDKNSDTGQRVEIIEIKKARDSKVVSLLTNKNVEKILHVFRMDMPLLELYTEKPIGGKVWDTKVMGKLVWINRDDNYGLKEMIRAFVNPHFKLKGEVYSDWDIDAELLTDTQMSYAAEDVLSLKLLKDKLYQLAERRGLTKVVDTAMGVIPALSEIRRAGYNIDVFAYKSANIFQ